MPRRKRVQQERKKVFCITAKKSVLRNYNFGQTLLLAPATNAISECSCSALRRIKTYLPFTMIKGRLNHCMMLRACFELGHHAQ